MQSPSEFLRHHILKNGIVHITAQQVVEMAEDQTSPLHSYFQWDDAIAGHHWRLWQARKLIARLTVTVEKKPDTQVRLMVSVPTDRGENGYMLMSEAVKDPAAREAIRKEMASRVAYWKEQSELLDISTVRWLDAFPPMTASIVEESAA